MEPAALDAKPKLPSYLMFYVNAFFTLSNRRTWSEDMAQKLLYSDMAMYSMITKWYDPTELVRFLIAMDESYLKAVNK